MSEPDRQNCECEKLNHRRTSLFFKIRLATRSNLLLQFNVIRCTQSRYSDRQLLYTIDKPRRSWTYQGRPQQVLVRFHLATILH